MVSFGGSPLSPGMTAQLIDTRRKQLGRSTGELTQSPQDEVHGHVYVVPIENVPMQVEALE
jgi:hypothetical protein